MKCYSDVIPYDVLHAEDRFALLRRLKLPKTVLLHTLTGIAGMIVVIRVVSRLQG